MGRAAWISLADGRRGGDGCRGYDGPWIELEIGCLPIRPPSLFQSVSCTSLIDGALVISPMVGAAVDRMDQSIISRVDSATASTTLTHSLPITQPKQGSATTGRGAAPLTRAGSGRPCRARRYPAARQRAAGSDQRLAAARGQRRVAACAFPPIAAAAASAPGSTRDDLC